MQQSNLSPKQRLEALPFGLYIHYPWCIKKCPYCDFNSHQSAVSADNTRDRQWLNGILRDLDLCQDTFGNRPISSVFIGGGTPSLLSPAVLELLLKHIYRHSKVAKDAEITMECNPNSTETKRFKDYAQSGVNRVSIGVQSLQPELLRALGRTHDDAQALHAIELALSSGFEKVNVDLMYGLPGQTPQEAEADLCRVADFDLSHISWYELTIEPNTPFYRQPPTLPQEETLAAIEHKGQETLRSRGFKQYEVSAWSKTKGDQCAHNLNYWRFGDYIGVGPGAHSKWSNNGVTRWSMLRKPQSWLTSLAPNTPRKRIEPQDIVFEFALNQLRLFENFTLKHFEQSTLLPKAQALQPLQLSIDKRFMVSNKGGYTITKLGRQYLNELTELWLPDAPVEAPSEAVHNRAPRPRSAQ